MTKRTESPSSGGPSLSHRTIRKSDALHSELVDWVTGLADWEIFFTGTYRGEFSEEASRKSFEKWAEIEIPEYSYLYSIERNPSRHGHHVHAIFADCDGIHRKTVWKKWFDRYGRAKVEQIRSREEAVSYVSKHVVGYMLKHGGWWNLKIGGDPPIGLVL